MAARRRSVRAHEQVLEAAIALFAERGLESTSMDAIADAAGVSKATIYRRFRDKNDLVTAAVVSFHPTDSDVFVGGTREQLVAFLQATRRRMVDGPGGVIMSQILAETQRNPELVKLHRERTVGPRVATIIRVLEAGIAAGEVRADLDLDVAAELLTGSWISRLVRGNDFPEDWSERVVDTIWPAISA